jgi:hypothetical protein
MLNLSYLEIQIRGGDLTLSDFNKIVFIETKKSLKNMRKKFQNVILVRKIRAINSLKNCAVHSFLLTFSFFIVMMHVMRRVMMQRHDAYHDTHHDAEHV